MDRVYAQLIVDARALAPNLIITLLTILKINLRQPNTHLYSVRLVSLKR
jgi:hypothetical protein